MTPEESLENAITNAGSMQALADRLGVTKGAVSQWKLSGRQVPAKHCQAIEAMTGGTSRCEDLRPDVFAPHHPAESDPGHAGRQPASPSNILDTIPPHSVVGIDPRGMP